LDCCYQPSGGQATTRAEEIGSLDRGECPAGAQLKVGDITVVEADRYQPRIIRPPQPQLVNSEPEFLVLVACPARSTMAGETRDEYQRVASDRIPDPGAPVLARPQAGRITPYGIPAAWSMRCNLPTSPESSRTYEMKA